MNANNPFQVSAELLGDRSATDRDVSMAEVSSRTIELLNQTRPWVQFIGVLLWISTVLMGIGSVAGVISGAVTSNGSVVFLSLLYLVFAIIYGYLARSLTTYARKINSLAASENSTDLEDALEAQKNFWRLTGIIMATMIVIYLGIIVLMVAGVGLMSFNSGL